MKHHPEQLPNQIYMGNEPKPYDKYDFHFRRGQIGWRTKTYGLIAYDINGRPIKEMVPVFIEASEVKAAIEHQKYLLEISPTPYGAAANIKIWQEMLDKGTAF